MFLLYFSIFSLTYDVCIFSPFFCVFFLFLIAMLLYCNFRCRIVCFSAYSPSCGLWRNIMSICLPSRVFILLLYCLFVMSMLFNSLLIHFCHFFYAPLFGLLFLFSPFVKSLRDFDNLSVALWRVSLSIYLYVCRSIHRSNWRSLLMALPHICPRISPSFAGFYYYYCTVFILFFVFLALVVRPHVLHDNMFVKIMQIFECVLIWDIYKWIFQHLEGFIYISHVTKQQQHSDNNNQKREMSTVLVKVRRRMNARWDTVFQIEWKIKFGE